jgi:hypothetical protein
MFIGLGTPLTARSNGDAAPYVASIGRGDFLTGTTLTADVVGLAGGEVVTYQWTDDGVNITGATSQSYTPTIGVDGIEDGSLVRCVVLVDGEQYLTAARAIRSTLADLVLLEDGDVLLLENGDRLLMEAA